MIINPENNQTELIKNSLKIKASRLFVAAKMIMRTILDAAGYGFRPISADGVPYIGRSNKLKNVVIATGHAMMGWSMSTGTGKIVAEIIDDKKTSINIDRFNPNRKF